MGIFDGRNNQGATPAPQGFNINLASKDVAGLVNAVWVEQNEACPYRKNGDTVEFATPRTGTERDQLSASIEQLGLGKFAIVGCSMPALKDLIKRQNPNFANTLGGLAGPGVKQILAEAGLAQDRSAEGVR